MPPNRNRANYTPTHAARRSAMISDAELIAAAQREERNYLARQQAQARSQPFIRAGGGNLVQQVIVV